MSVPHSASVCSCNNCKSSECFVKRKTLYSCPDALPISGKKNEDNCLQTHRTYKNDSKLCHHSGRDISDCCKSFSVNSRIQHNDCHSSNTLTNLSTTGSNKNEELIKVINETITQKLRTDVRELLEEFRRCLIDITTKESRLKALQQTESKKDAEHSTPEARASSKTLSAKQDTHENPILAPFELQEHNVESKSFDNTQTATKLDHLIETAKVIKLDGGVEFRHEQFFRNYGDPNKKYGELITKDEIRTTKTYKNVIPDIPKVDQKDSRLETTYCQKLLENAKLCCDVTKDSTKLPNLTNFPNKLPAIEQNTLSKPWRCMIIEDTSSEGGNKTSAPSYYILEQIDFSKKPEIKVVDGWLPSPEPFLWSNQELITSKEKAVKEPDPRCCPMKASAQTMTANQEAKDLKSDCLCWNTLEEYLTALSNSQIKPEQDMNECCIHKKGQFFGSKNEVPKKSVIEKHNKICDTFLPPDNINCLLKSLLSREQRYRCKCAIKKSQCHALQCCDKYEDICILEKVRAQANRVHVENGCCKHELENIPTQTVTPCKPCKRNMPDIPNINEECQICSNKPNETNPNKICKSNQIEKNVCKICKSNQIENNLCKICKSNQIERNLCNICQNKQIEDNLSKICQSNPIENNPRKICHSNPIEKHTCKVYLNDPTENNTCKVYPNNPNENNSCTICQSHPIETMSCKICQSNQIENNSSKICQSNPIENNASKICQSNPNENNTRQICSNNPPDNNSNKIFSSNANDNNSCTANSVGTETQSQNAKAVTENIYYACDVNICDINQNKNYQETTSCKANSACTSAQDVENDPNSTGFDQIISKLQITPYDILNKLKEAYKACSCKVCACVAGPNKCEVAAPKKSATCQCESRCSTGSEAPKPKPIRPNKWATRGLRSQYTAVKSDQNQMKDIIFGLGKIQDEGCTCLPCDCLKCSKVATNPCACAPCECLQCYSKGGECVDQTSIIVAPVEEELRRNICTCDPCQCAACGISMARVSTTRETATETGRRACDCAVCHNEACLLGGTDNCTCLGQNTIVTKPVEKDQNDFDIRTVVIENKRVSNNCGGPCNNTPYATFAALTDNKPQFLSNKTKTDNCLCKECECLTCDKKDCGLKYNKNGNIYNCKCSTCECEVCPSRNANDYVKQCECSVCECIQCETKPRSNLFIRNTPFRLPLAERQKKSFQYLDTACSCKVCVCENCSDDCPKKHTKPKHLSKKNSLLPNDNETSNTALKSNTVSQISTAIGSEDPSWSQTTEVSSERISLPSSCIKQMGVNDIPTKDEPNMFFNPEYDYIQELINYKTVSIKKSLDDKVLIPVRPRIFNPPANDENSLVTNNNSKPSHLTSAKPVIPRKKTFETPPFVHRAGKIKYPVNKKSSNSSSPRKSSLNLIAKSNECAERVSGGKWIKESDFVLRRCETKSSHFAGSYIKSSNIKYVKASDVLTNARRFSLSLLKILEKYEKANQEFQSTSSSKFLNQQNSSKHGCVGYLYNLSMLYKNKSDICYETPGSQSYALDFKESLTKGGFVLDMRRQNTYENIVSISTVRDNREACETCKSIIIRLLNLLHIVETQNFKQLTKVRTVLNLCNKSNHCTKTIEINKSECFNSSKHDFKISSKERYGLEIMPSIPSSSKKSSKNARIASPTQQRSTNLPESGGHIQDESKNNENSVSRALNTFDSKTTKLDNNESPPEENDEIEVTVCVSTADMDSLGSMEGNCVYVINNNRHPFREFLDDPSLHILKKTTRLDEALYPKLSPAYPSMQFDIKNTLHSMARHDSYETGPTSTRHMLHTMTKTEFEHKIVETSSLIASTNIVNGEESSSRDDSRNLNVEDEKRETSQHEHRAVTPIRSILLNERSDHQTLELKSSSYEAFKVHFLSVTRISNHTVIIKWNQPESLEGVRGYELLIDDVPVKTDLGPTRCMAVVTCIPQSEKILLTIKTIVEFTNGVKRYPTFTMEYHPRINS